MTRCEFIEKCAKDFGEPAGHVKVQMIRDREGHLCPLIDMDCSSDAAIMALSGVIHAMTMTTSLTVPEIITKVMIRCGQLERGSAAVDMKVVMDAMQRGGGHG